MATIEDMEELVFSCCGAVAWLPRTFLRDKRETGEKFFCPNGHNRVFKETRGDRLQKELDESKKRLAAKELKIQGLTEGKCPFCWKTVKDLSGHIERNHK
jgi:hypothetical protein